MAPTLDGALSAGMARLSIAGAAPAAGAGALAHRAVTPYTQPLANALGDGLPVKVLHALIAEYLKPNDTELLLNATFIDYIPAGELRDEIQLTAQIWGKYLTRMDYSRVTVLIDCGRLPLYNEDRPIESDIDLNGTIPFRGRDGDPVLSSTYYSTPMFAELAQLARYSYFPNVVSLINPSGTFKTHVWAPAVRLMTTAQLQIERATGNNRAAEIDESVTVTDPVAVLYAKFVTVGKAKPENPTYVVELNLQPMREGRDAGLDPEQEPFFRMTRYKGTMRHESEELVQRVFNELPLGFREVPLPEEAPAADANGYFG